MDIASGKIASEVLEFRLHAEIDGCLRGLSAYQIEEEYKSFLAGRAMRQQQEREHNHAR